MTCDIRHGAAVLEHVVGALRCPFGEPGLTTVDGGLVCSAGHRFDLARQGYVNLLTGPPPAGVETAAMVAARAEVQAAGHHDVLTDALRTVVTDSIDAARPTVVDLGAGTGHHLAEVLEGLGDGAVGLAVDLSKHAARRAARAHDRIGAVVADVWGELPVGDDVADAVLVVFAPRNATEIGRILRSGGIVVVVTPAPGHLRPLVDRLGLLGTGPAKLDHLDAQLGEVVALEARGELTWARTLRRDEVRALVTSGPNAWHVEPARLARHLDDLPDPCSVGFAVTVSIYRA